MSGNRRKVEETGSATQRQPEEGSPEQENQNFEAQEQRQDKMLRTHPTDEKSDEDYEDFALETQRIEAFQSQEQGLVPL